MLERARDLMPQNVTYDIDVLVMGDTRLIKTRRNVYVVFNFAGKREGAPTSPSVRSLTLLVLHMLIIPHF